MTALCGGGTSAANPTAAAVVSVTLDFLSLATDTYEIEWLAQALGAVGPFVPYTLSTFCATDPPAMPTWTLAESTALQALDILSADFASGAAKIPNWVANVVWNSYCQCTSGTYTPAANPATPAGTPIPTATTGLTTNTACLQAEFNPANSFSGSQAGLVSGAQYTGFMAVPAGATSIQWVSRCTEVGPTPHGSYVSTLKFYASDHSTVLGTTFGQQITINTAHGTGQDRLWSVSTTDGIALPASLPPGLPSGFIQAVCQYGTTTQLPLGTAYIGCTYTALANSGDTITCYVATYCGGDTPGGSQAQGCCPVSPAQTALLNSILSTVTLLQRQTAPFAYVLGTSHSVSGTGSITVQGLLGVKVTLATIGPEIGQEAGTPDALFSAGWINWGTADGYTAREYIANSPFLSMPAEAGQYTLVGYSFPSSVSATIVEISREP
jgi:hypothetical protein